MFIGRERELASLALLLEKGTASIVACRGRRRIGKSTLIKEFANRNGLKLINIDGLPLRKRQANHDQLVNFALKLAKSTGHDIGIPQNWFEAFHQLWNYLSSIEKKRIVVFLDELPWMETPKSNFITAFGYFWNSWASTRDGLTMIVCGSSTSWMIDKIIGDTGGLYGRVSRSIYLSPFNLHEVEQFLIKRKGIIWSRYQILQTYMVLGGIPYYLELLDKNLPFDQNIDNLFYRKGAPLRAEYDFLFRSLFKSSEVYRKVVEVISLKNKGLTLKEIKEGLKAHDSGKLTTVLNNLIKCDFIRKYWSYGKKERGAIYQLTDPYSLYYLKFIAGQSGQDEHYWSNIKESTRNAWAGYAFEQVCLHHINQIRSKLSIKGVLTNICTWSSPKHTDNDGNEWPGIQIDLLLCRGDHVIDICEMKYSQSLFTVSREYDQHLRERTGAFVHLTKTRDAIHMVLVTTYGLKHNMYSSSFQATVTMDDLFSE